MKVFAFYLPQFHPIPENNEWWGEGFTEWTNVKSAKPLFAGHKQPLHPLHDNYYDLLDKSTVLWQTDLLKKYRIDGFIYYHYFFAGKLLLEKPISNILKDKSINQPFFFCWANHSWKRSWDGTSTILVEQTYGQKEVWEKHFQYLLPFFKDYRYEKKNNKPLFMVFHPCFVEKNEMMNYFDQRCKEEGFDGIAVIDSIQNIFNNEFDWYRKNPSKTTEYLFYREPGFGCSLFEKNHKVSMFLKKVRTSLRSRFRIGNYVKTFSGNKVLKESMRYKAKTRNCLNGLFFEWDNTPRHGFRGYIIKPISKKTFLEFLKKNKYQDYIFINAWNEWCEGMVLEPTKENGYKYLKWIKEWREFEINDVWKTDSEK